MAKVKRKGKQQKATTSPFKDYWDKKNYVFLGLGLLIIIFGFIFMSEGPWDNPVSLTLSPIVLLVAYIIIFPLSIFFRKKKEQINKSDNVPG